MAGQDGKVLNAIKRSYVEIRVNIVCNSHNMTLFITSTLDVYVENAVPLNQISTQTNMIKTADLDFKLVLNHLSMLVTKYCPFIDLQCTQMRPKTTFILFSYTEPEVFPLFYYNRTGLPSAAAIGGHVYRGCMNPNYNGWYIFGDYGNQLVHLADILRISCQSNLLYCF